MALNQNIIGFLKNLFSRKKVTGGAILEKRIESIAPKAAHNPTPLHSSSKKSKWEEFIGEDLPPLKPKPDDEEMLLEHEIPLSHSRKPSIERVDSFQDFIREYGHDSHTPHHEPDHPVESTFWQDFINENRFQPPQHHEHDHDFER